MAPLEIEGSQGSRGSAQNTADQAPNSAAHLLDRDLRRRLQLLNDLRDIGLGDVVKIDLPRIAVVGGQSAGKSSVLESIVNLDIFPRHKDICTRRPIELRLVHADIDGIQATFRHQGVACSNLMTSVADIRNEIARRNMDKVTDDAPIFEDPITLEIRSAHVPDLTVIDLPGIARNTATGNQRNQNIEKLTTALSRKYIKEERTIILAVSAANADLAGSDALTLARIEDEHGVRTTGVITKVDIMDAGTDAAEILLGKVHKLKKGYFALKNRSQKEVDDKKSVQEAIITEDQFFKSHPVYSKLLSRCGTRSLVSALQRDILALYDAHIPDIKAQISNMIKQEEQDLKALGAGVPEDAPSQMEVLLDTMSRFRKRLSGLILGNDVSRTDTLVGGAFIRKSVFEPFENQLNLIPFAEASETDIYNLILNNQGIRPDDFVPFDAFSILAKEAIERFHGPASELIEAVFMKMFEMIRTAADEAFGSFEILRAEICTSIVDPEGEGSLVMAKTTAHNLVKALIDCKGDHIFIRRSDFNAAASKMPSENLKSKGPGEFMRAEFGNLQPSSGRLVVVNPATVRYDGNDTSGAPGRADIIPTFMHGRHVVEFVLGAPSAKVSLDVFFGPEGRPDGDSEVVCVSFASVNTTGFAVSTSSAGIIDSNLKTNPAPALKNGSMLQMQVFVEQDTMAVQLFVDGVAVLRDPYTVQSAREKAAAVEGIQTGKIELVAKARISLFTRTEQISITNYLNDRYAVAMTKKLLQEFVSQNVAALASDVPQVVGSVMLNKFEKKMEVWLERQRTKWQSEGRPLAELLSEPRDIKEHRAALVARLKVLRASQSKLALLG